MGLSKMLLECEMRSVVKIFKLGILGEGIPFSKDLLILPSFKILRGTLSSQGQRKSKTGDLFLPFSLSFPSRVSKVINQKDFNNPT